MCSCSTYDSEDLPSREKNDMIAEAEVDAEATRATTHYNAAALLTSGGWLSGKKLRQPNDCMFTKCSQNLMLCLHRHCSLYCPIASSWRALPTVATAAHARQAAIALSSQTSPCLAIEPFPL